MTKEEKLRVSAEIAQRRIDDELQVTVREISNIVSNINIELRKLAIITQGALIEATISARSCCWQCEETQEELRYDADIDQSDAAESLTSALKRMSDLALSAVGYNDKESDND